MITLVKQELFKLIKKKSTLVLSILLVLLMIFYAVLARRYPEILTPGPLFANMYGSTEWIIFFLIAAASSIVAMEFQFGTIKNLLYRSYSRGEVIVSKWLTLFLYSLYFYALSFVVSVILKLVLFPSISFADGMSGGQTLLQQLLQNAFGNYIGTWLIISLVLMLACFFNSSGAAISAGLVFYFASSIISGIQFVAIERWEWVKWNPFNMLNLSSQIGNEELLEPMTHVSTNAMLAGNLVYIALFLFLGYFVFKRKNV